VGKYIRNTASCVTLENYIDAAARCQGLRAALSASGDIVGVAACRSGRRGEPRIQQDLRAGWIAGRPEPYSLGGASQAQIGQEDVTPDSGDLADAGGAGVQMSSLMSAPVRCEGVRRRDMEAI